MAVPWRGEEPALDIEEEDSSQADDVASLAPTPAVLQFLRGALPTTSQRDILRAWDTTREGNSSDERAQACLEKLLTQSDEGPAKGTTIDLTGLDESQDTKSTGRVKAQGSIIDLDDMPDSPQRPAGSSQVPPSPVFDQDAALVSLASLFPDIEPDFASQILRRAEWRDKPLHEQTELSVEYLFGLNGAYKKVERAPAPQPKKRKRAEAEEEAERVAAEEERYLKRKLTDHPDCEYEVACVAILCDEFPTIPKPHVTKVAKRNRFWYAPTYEALEADLKPRGNFIAFTPLKNPRKGKGAAVLVPDDLETERTWFMERRARANEIKAVEEAQKLADAQEEAAGLLISCGCCYGEMPFRKMVQCSDAHLFCNDCAKSHVETLIGQRRIDLTCMDESGCSAEFPDAELKRILDEGTMQLLARFRQEKAVDLAGIEGLEKCGFCDFAVIIENPNEKLLRCGNEECGKVQCRKCKKDDHLPLSCEEYEKELASNSLHRVEEAMTAALIRNCPKCQQPYVKSDGCNKIACTHCGQLSCFVCKQAISGYEHFAGAEAYTHGRRVDAGAKCVLFDDTIKRTHEEVEAARKAAADQVGRANPHVAKADLDRLKEPEIHRPPPAAHPHYRHGGGAPVHHHHHHYGQLAAPHVPQAYNAGVLVGGVPFDHNAYIAHIAQLQAQAAQLGLPGFNMVVGNGAAFAIPRGRGRHGRR